MCALWSLPILVVLENNRYAQSTPIEQHLAGTISGRFEAFGIPVVEEDTTDVARIHAVAGPLLDQVRQACEPRALVLHTYRFGPHSKGDDTRDPDEIARYRRRDPLSLAAQVLSEATRESIRKQVAEEVDSAFGRAQADPPADPSSLATGEGVAG
jgi:TPP-dependent pyruvate/acetoin dehydrogenase alpha subunit